MTNIILKSLVICVFSLACACGAAQNGEPLTGGDPSRDDSVAGAAEGTSVAPAEPETTEEVIETSEPL